MIRRRSLAGLCGVVAWLGLRGVADTVAPAALADHPAHEFLFGADFDSQAPEPIRELFYESGMNCVRMTGGGYSWSVEMNKKLADDFEARGLKVYMQLGSHYPSADYFGLKDAYMVDQAGKSGVVDKKAWAVSYSGQNWPQYSYTSGVFRKKLKSDFTNYVGRFRGNHNIAGVILHNEAGFFWLQDRVFDYSPGTLVVFRAWLQKQYGSIAALNARWGTSFASFDVVVPPGRPPVADVAGWMDWRRFSEGSVSDFLRWESDFFKTLRPDVPRTTNLDGPVSNWYGYRCANPLDFSADMDRAGMDIYPSAWSMRTFIPYSMDMLQGVAQGRETNVIECDVFSAKLWKFSEDARAGLLSSEVWTMIGHGADGVLLWGFNRTDDFSLTDGKFNARLRVCRDIAATARMIRLGDFHRVRPEVAVCVDPDSYLYASAVGRGLELTSQLDDENQGYYAALSDAGISSDVILADQVRAGAWKNYKAIVVPAETMMDDALASQWRSFVAGGGVLIVGAPFAERDRWGAAQGTVPAGLDDVFGMKVTGAPGVEKTAQVKMDAGNLALLDPRENVVVGQEQVLAKFGDNGPAAITSNSFQQGKAVFIAGRPGKPYGDGWGGSGLPKLLAGILSQASFSPAIVWPGKANDTSAIVDRSGNVLMVFSVLGEKGQLPKAAPAGRAVYVCGDPASYTAAFAFPGTRIEGDRVRSGPVPVTLTVNADQHGITLELPQVAATLPVLLAKNAPPLLATDAPAVMARGHAGEVKVTCFNPSAIPLQGRISVSGSFAGSPLDGGVVSVPTQGKEEVVIPIHLQGDQATGRVPLHGVLDLDNPERKIDGIPVDISVK